MRIFQTNNRNRPMARFMHWFKYITHQSLKIINDDVPRIAPETPPTIAERINKFYLLIVFLKLKGMLPKIFGGSEHSFVLRTRIILSSFNRLPIKRILQLSLSGREQTNSPSFVASWINNIKYIIITIIYFHATYLLFYQVSRRQRHIFCTLLQIMAHFEMPCTVRSSLVLCTVLNLKIIDFILNCNTLLF